MNNRSIPLPLLLTVILLLVSGNLNSAEKISIEPELIQVQVLTETQQLATINTAYLLVNIQLTDSMKDFRFTLDCVEGPCTESSKFKLMTFKLAPEELTSWREMVDQHFEDFVSAGFGAAVTFLSEEETIITGRLSSSIQLHPLVSYQQISVRTPFKAKARSFSQLVAKE